MRPRENQGQQPNFQHRACNQVDAAQLEIRLLSLIFPPVPLPAGLHD
jgi:hypothetical protein